METKKASEYLRAFKQFNKVAREVRAKKLGFLDAATYIGYLESLVNSGDKSLSDPSSKGVKGVQKTSPKSSSKSKSVKSTKTTSKELPTIHIVDVLDSSGSMQGGKHTAALKGINAGIADLKASDAKVNYTYTLVDFSTDVVFSHTKDKLSAVGEICTRTRSSTALFDAIGQTVTKISSGIAKGDKVLVNIYTDGQENASRSYSARNISDFIEQLSKEGWTFTFIGTDNDVRYATNILKIHVSNSMTYDGTAQGLEKSLTATRSARTAYASAVQDGLDVSVGFYKNIESSKDSKSKKK